MPITDLDPNFSAVEKEYLLKEKERLGENRQRERAIRRTANIAHQDILKHQREQLKKILEEEADARRKAKVREEILKKEFKRVMKNVSGVIKSQRLRILSYFGPLVQ